VIEPGEIAQWATSFGVTADQVRRDHFVSHLLVAIAAASSAVSFFGGTALCRTHLNGTRISEDIDLLHRDPAETLDVLRHALPRALRAEFPGTLIGEAHREGNGDACTARWPGVGPIKVYVGRSGPDTRGWELVPTDVALRYSDLPTNVRFPCPTLATFAAMKLEAWYDRHAPRDLFDLAGLAAHPGIDTTAVDTILRRRMRHGFVAPEMDRVPATTQAAWHTELAAQVGILPSPQECLERAALRFRTLADLTR
jgi:hypothetical protein